MLRNGERNITSKSAQRICPANAKMAQITPNIKSEVGNKRKS